MIYSIKRGDFDRLISLSKKSYDVFGPIRKDSSVSFESIENPEDIVFEIGRAHV